MITILIFVIGFGSLLGIEKYSRYRFVVDGFIFGGLLGFLIGGLIYLVLGLFFVRDTSSIYGVNKEPNIELIQVLKDGNITETDSHYEVFTLKRDSITIRDSLHLNYELTKYYIKKNECKVIYKDTTESYFYKTNYVYLNNAPVLSKFVIVGDTVSRKVIMVLPKFSKNQLDPIAQELYLKSNYKTVEL